MSIIAGNSIRLLSTINFVSRYYKKKGEVSPLGRLIISNAEHPEIKRLLSDKNMPITVGARGSTWKKVEAYAFSDPPKYPSDYGKVYYKPDVQGAANYVVDDPSDGSPKVVVRIISKGDIPEEGDESERGEKYIDVGEDVYILEVYGLAEDYAKIHGSVDEKGEKKKALTEFRDQFIKGWKASANPDQTKESEIQTTEPEL